MQHTRAATPLRTWASCQRSRCGEVGAGSGASLQWYLPPRLNGALAPLGEAASLRGAAARTAPWPPLGGSRVGLGGGGGAQRPAGHVRVVAGGTLAAEGAWVVERPEPPDWIHEPRACRAAGWVGALPWLSRHPFHPSLQRRRWRGTRTAAGEAADLLGREQCGVAFFFARPGRGSRRPPYTIVAAHELWVVRASVRHPTCPGRCSV